MYAGLARSENVGGSIKLFGAAWGTGAIVASRGRVMENGNLCCPTSLPSLSDAGVHTGSVISKKTSSSSPTAVVPARTFSKAEKKKRQGPPVSGAGTDRQARRRNSEGHEPEGVTYSDGQALERLGLGKVEQHLPFDGIAFKEQRRVLRIHRSAPDFEGNPIATALILEHIAMFVPEACPKRSWHRGVCWWFVVTILHDQGANRAIDGGPPEGFIDYP